MKKLLFSILLVTIYTSIFSQQREVQVNHIMEERFVYLQDINGSEDHILLVDGTKYLAFSSLDEAKNYLTSVSPHFIENRKISRNKIYIYTKTGREKSYTASVFFAEE